MPDLGNSANWTRPIFRIIRNFSRGLSWCKLQHACPLRFLSAARSRSRPSGDLSEAGGTSCPAVVSAEAAPKLEIAWEPDAQDVRMVREAIYAYNRSKAGDQRYEPLTIFLRDSRGGLVGGLLGSTYWQWLTMDFLWVAEDLRGRGHGRQLVVAAEGEGLRRGCKHACLDTFSFQAKGFYEGLGYLAFGVLDDFPGEHKRYFLRKKLGT
jgi:GNAT superfamily N-acetyltransferase